MWGQEKEYQRNIKNGSGEEGTGIKKKEMEEKTCFFQKYLRLSCQLSALNVKELNMTVVKNKIMSRLLPSGFARINHLQNVPLDK